METRQLGNLWPVSVLTLGGTGLANPPAPWGGTPREERIATLIEAVESGVSLLDVAPAYGDGEAETVVGDAFAGRLPSGVRISTKHWLEGPPAREVYDRLRRSLESSLSRMRLASVDVLFLHGQIVPDVEPGGVLRVSSGRPGTPLSLFSEAVVPAFERLVADDLIAAWGITSIGVPSALLQVLSRESPPAVVQCIANPLDSAGTLDDYDEEPRHRDLIAAAAARGIGVIGIRALAAGALTDGLDRAAVESYPAELRNLDRAAPFRAIAHELGVTSAYLAYRYALAVEGVDTIAVGLKSRTELGAALQAVADGPLAPDVVARINRAVRPRREA